MIKPTKISPLSESPEETLDAYILAHSDPEGDYLHRLYRATNIHTVHGRMASGHLQGRVLKMLVTMIRPKNILEVGTFSGYSAICLAEGLPEGGRVWTFEVNDEMEDFTRPWLEGSQFADRINFIIGDANVEAPRSTVTSERISKPMKWHSLSPAVAATSWPITRFGTVM